MRMYLCACWIAVIDALRLLLSPRSVAVLAVKQVWQAILTKKVELNSWKMKRSVSNGARDLLKV
jgi:hypothetical protein